MSSIVRKGNGFKILFDLNNIGDNQLHCDFESFLANRLEVSLTFVYIYIKKIYQRLLFASSLAVCRVEKKACLLHEGFIHTRHTRGGEEYHIYWYIYFTVGICCWSLQVYESVRLKSIVEFIFFFSGITQFSVKFRGKILKYYFVGL